jgi:hypothetical protein
VEAPKTAEPSFCWEFLAAMKDGPRLYFAPLLGAINAVRAELLRIHSERNSVVRFD